MTRRKLGPTLTCLYLAALAADHIRNEGDSHRVRPRRHHPQESNR